MSDESPSGAVCYEVSVEIAERDAARFVEYMTERHINHVLATGCFTGATFSTAGEGHFRTSYRAASRLDLERYLREHANALREDFASQFGDEARVSREIWMELRHWPR